MTRAAIYSRFSSDRQNESSIADQHRVCVEYAKRQQWPVIEHYSDASISGAAMGNRPAFQRMRADAMAGKFGVLLVTDTSRLARSQELAPLIDRFRFQRVRVVGVQDSFDSNTGTADMQAGLSGIMSVEFRRMVKARTHAALESRAKTKRATGGKAYGYTSTGGVVPREAEVVREIFTRFAAGESYRVIAASLNARNVPSPGTAWKREQRRCSGWMGSAVRVILFNERYRAVIHWNVSEWRKDPDTGKRQRVMRPRSEWVTYVEESQRIVSDALWERARRRVRVGADDPRLKSGGRPRFLLSGLLVCDTCNAHYILDSAVAYRCSSYLNGNACTNAVRVRRDHAQRVLIDPIRDELLSPRRVAVMAKEMQTYYAQQVRAMQTQAAERPRELQELDARIERLRERLRKGDPDMTHDEIQAAIDRAEGKRRELSEQAGIVMPSRKLIAMLPQAAELYRQQIALGLEGDPKASLSARTFLREWFSGEIRLVPDADGGLVAHWKLDTGALFRAVVDLSDR
jgi:DNA invertase Pin-like site-specific DNA recombinase